MFEFNSTTFIFIWTFLCSGLWAVSEKSEGFVKVNMSLLIPANESYLFSASKISPAILIGLQNANNSYWNNISVTITSADSRCRESICMNEAIELYVNHRPQIFIGPTCDLAVATVARQASLWNIPIISVGALARDFRINKKKSYNLLTRLGPANLNTLSYFLKHLFEKTRFQKIKMLYSRDEAKDVFDLFCHHVTESIVNDLHDQSPNISMTFYRMEEPLDVTKVLKTQISLSFGGKLYDRDMRLGYRVVMMML